MSRKGLRLSPSNHCDSRSDVLDQEWRRKTSRKKQK